MLLLVAAWGMPAAGARILASNARLTLAGEPTPAEETEIVAQWDRLREAFPTAGECLGHLTVVVVASAEAEWSGSIRNIAAFYRPSENTVYIEHGKVRAEHLIHEFAHHLDFSCGFGSGAFGAAFLSAQGFAPNHAWANGAAWNDVPAEYFAEAVVGYLGIDSVDLPVSPQAFRLVTFFATRATDAEAHLRVTAL